MKYFCFLFLLAWSQAFVVDNIKKDVPKQGPVLLSMTALDPPSFQVTWKEMEYLGDEPVIGYKLFVWELDDVMKTTYHVKDGQVVPETKLEPQKVDRYQPIREAQVVTVEGFDQTTALFSPAKVNIQYQVRVAAFTKGGVGPMSPQSLGLKMISIR